MPDRFGNGTINSRAVGIAGLIRVRGMMLFEKQAVLSMALQFPVSSGSLRKIGLVWVSKLEKSPRRKSAGGTFPKRVLPRRRRKPSQEKNQNIFSRRSTFGSISGPPTATPYWFSRNGVLPKPLRLAKNSFASNASLRRYS